MPLMNKKEDFYLLKKKIDKNIISHLFFGIYKNSYHCLRCLKTTFSFKFDKSIIFNLEKINKYHKKNYLSIEDLFNFKYNSLNSPDTTSFLCDRCKNKGEYKYGEIIFNPPEILVLILDRGQDPKFKGKIEFNNKLYIKQIDSQSDFVKSNSNLKYELKGVINICHDGHYIAYSLMDNMECYKFNDNYVQKALIKDIYNEESYMLFYQRGSDW